MRKPKINGRRKQQRVGVRNKQTQGLFYTHLLHRLSLISYWQSRPEFDNWKVDGLTVNLHRRDVSLCLSRAAVEGVFRFFFISAMLVVGMVALPVWFGLKYRWWSPEDESYRLRWSPEFSISVIFVVFREMSQQLLDGLPNWYTHSPFIHEFSDTLTLSFNLSKSFQL